MKQKCLVLFKKLNHNLMVYFINNILIFYSKAPKHGSSGTLMGMILILFSSIATVRTEIFSMEHSC